MLGPNQLSGLHNNPTFAAAALLGQPAGQRPSLGHYTPVRPALHAHSKVRHT